jgi:tRNA(Ile)-lysidine synthase
MALLHALALVRQRFGLILSAHGVHHGLRPEADDELTLASDFSRSHEVPFSVSRLELAPGGNLQARAREARYAALRREAARVGANLIATAHHADDRAETVLLRLLRGAGVAGLGVLAVHSEDLVRPLIRAPRTAILRHLMRHSVPYRDDPSNSDPRFMRVRVRHELLPLLKQLSPGIVNHLTSLADQVSMRDAADPLDVDGCRVSLNRGQRLQLAQLASAPRSGGRIALPGGKELSLDAKTGKPVVGTRPSRTPASRDGKREKC